MLVDSSVWIDFARDVRSPQVDALTRAVTARTAMTTDAVRLELLAGVTRFDLLASALDACEDLAPLLRVDVEDAAAMYRTCRRAGETIRSLNDCLIAAIAIRNDVPVLHHDRDFDIIAQHTPLKVVLT